MKVFMMQVSRAEFELRCAMDEEQRCVLERRIEALHDRWVHSQACPDHATVDTTATVC